MSTNIRRKTRSCISMQLRHQCNEGDKCKYAHSTEELIIKQCRSGDSCPLIRIKAKPIGMWKVVNLQKVCHFKHPAETLENYLIRIGWELKATELKIIYPDEEKKVPEIENEEPLELTEQEKTKNLLKVSKEQKIKRCKAIIKKTGKVCNNKIKKADINYDYCGKHKKWRII